MRRLHTILVSVCIVAFVAACQSTHSATPVADQYTKPTTTLRPEAL
ncbi:MAG: hypothetical protein GFH27_549331n45 [Chloroflexi bacterium AL-W]|nr:hypothetical protein [Chloroflexi bacterium AL-N1]NOK70346.1 hypothetical protein [Chloroflexi bacterium AL-N10]NOK78024.1 hypothetical protein [Chloroflexi bacterium AL-N5]NOK85123.1 hypothetical protein [Chloroflexi bacterium AL-W]NOK92112.1 hypothetical protein [Chloroflexi bacterium AL-N15]